jgi:hypothetical protein
MDIFPWEIQAHKLGYGATTELALLKYPLSSMELHFQIFQVRI